MTRCRQYTDEDVLTAAERRVRTMFDTHDRVVVFFSGGKDSTVCLELCLREARKRGKLPLDVVFWDEEILSQHVIDNVNMWRQHPEIRMRWLAWRFISPTNIMGRAGTVIFWDPTRKNMREKPEWAEPEPPGYFPSKTADLNAVVAKAWPGKLAFVLGIRAAEGLSRLRGFLRKTGHTEIAQDRICPRVALIRPIYDWEHDDVYKFLHEQEVPTCHYYYLATMGGGDLRVATAFNVGGAKRVCQIKTVDPDYWQRLCDVFPDMAMVQDRLFNDLDRQAPLEAYAAEGWDGCFRYIKEMIPDPLTRKAARARLRQHMRRASRRPLLFWPEDFLKAAISGAIHRLIPPNYARQRKHAKRKA